MWDPKTWPPGSTPLFPVCVSLDKTLVLVSDGCCDKLPQTRWFETRHLGSGAGLEVRSMNQSEGLKSVVLTPPASRAAQSCAPWLLVPSSPFKASAWPFASVITSSSPVVTCPSDSLLEGPSRVHFRPSPITQDNLPFSRSPTHHGFKVLFCRIRGYAQLSGLRGGNLRSLP